MTKELEPRVYAAAERWIDGCHYGPREPADLRKELVEFAGSTIHFALQVRELQAAIMTSQDASMFGNILVEELAETTPDSPFDRVAQLMLHQVSAGPAIKRTAHIEGSRGRVGFAGQVHEFPLRLNHVSFDILRAVDYSQQPPVVSYTAQSHGVPASSV